MKLLVGLGNPGGKYESSRHNTGFMVANRLAGGKSWSKSKSGLLEYVWTTVGEEKAELIKPMTFMNKSGEALGYVMKQHPDIYLEDIWVVHDDLDIELGKYKIQRGKGPKQHNGVESIEKQLRTNDFWRVRVGVDNRSQTLRLSGSTNSAVRAQGDSLDLKSLSSESSVRIPGERYVLGSFGEDEREVIEGVIGEIAEEVIRRFDGSL